MRHQYLGSMQRISALFLFSLPALFFYAVFFLLPIINSFVYSLTSWNGITGSVAFIGLDNFRRAFHDRDFWNSFGVTITFGIVYVSIVNILAFALALLLDRKMPFRNAIRAIVFMPNAITLIVIAFIWQVMFTKIYGSLVDILGLPFLDISWFSTGPSALVTVVITFVWQTVGYYMVIFLVGLQMINQDYYEAAEIDGADGFQKLHHITLPLMMPSITVTFFISTASSFKMFDLFFQMTGGGPGKTTMVMSFAVYNEAFNVNRVGYACTLAFILFCMVLVVTWFQLQFTKKREVVA